MVLSKGSTYGNRIALVVSVEKYGRIRIAGDAIVTFQVAYTATAMLYRYSFAVGHGRAENIAVKVRDAKCAATYAVHYAHKDEHIGGNADVIK